jgi:hypothetical protein
MKTLTFRTDLLRAEVETLMNWKFNKEFIECKKSEADYKVIEKWKNHENKMRQKTIYLRVDEVSYARS